MKARAALTLINTECRLKFAGRLGGERAATNAPEQPLRAPQTRP
jgi:hypothetical protein